MTDRQFPRAGANAPPACGEGVINQGGRLWMVMPGRSMHVIRATDNACQCGGINIRDFDDGTLLILVKRGPHAG